MSDLRLIDGSRPRRLSEPELEAYKACRVARNRDHIEEARLRRLKSMQRWRKVQVLGLALKDEWPLMLCLVVILALFGLALWIGQ